MIRALRRSRDAAPGRVHVGAPGRTSRVAAEELHAQPVAVAPATFSAKDSRTRDREERVGATARGCRLTRSLDRRDALRDARRRRRLGRADIVRSAAARPARAAHGRLRDAAPLLAVLEDPLPLDRAAFDLVLCDGARSCSTRDQGAGDEKERAGARTKQGAPIGVSHARLLRPGRAAANEAPARCERSRRDPRRRPGGASTTPVTR